MLCFPKATAWWCAGLTLLTGGPATAQWFARGGADCGCAPPAMTYAAPTMTACTACAPVVQTVCAPPVQPVMQTVYRDVPVVEYQRVRQTVKKPVVETKYVDQAVTEYRPVTEQRVVNVPTVSYQDVTECQTQCRNVGYWRTRYEPNCKYSPCEVDSRPGMAGWFNRTIYDVRSAFTPAYNVRREYVPQTVTQQVPVTRRVAIQGSKQVAYNVTNMVPYQTTRKVAVNETRWIDEEVTVMKPTTVVRTMAVGTQITYAPIGSTGTATAVAPQPDNIGRGPTPRSANGDSLNNADPNRAVDPRRTSIDTEPRSRQELIPTALPPQDATVVIRPRLRTPDADLVIDLGAAAPALALNDGPTANAPVTAASGRSTTFKTPSAVTASGWVARSKTPPASSPAPSAISVADVDRTNPAR